MIPIPKTPKNNDQFQTPTYNNTQKKSPAQLSDSRAKDSYCHTPGRAQKSDSRAQDSYCQGSVCFRGSVYLVGSQPFVRRRK